MSTFKIFLFMILFAAAINLTCSQSDEKYEKYLTKYKYMGENHPDPRMNNLKNYNEKIRLAIKWFQRLAGLFPSGDLTKETKDMMDMPRCGMPDITNKMSMTRKRRYAAIGPAWPKTALTYKYNNYSPDLELRILKSDIEKAFRMWQNVSALTFTEAPGNQPVDIDLLFSRAAHGDGNDFDGPNGVLAHAFFPTNGDAHFDEDESWTSGDYKGINLLQVAVHEFGHSLGLGHSDVPGSIMLPIYTGYNPNFALSLDDIRGIQQLYGPPRAGPTQRATSFQMPTLNTRNTPAPGPLTTRRGRPAAPVLCDSNPPDAIFAISSTIFIFKGDKFYLSSGPMTTSYGSYNTRDYFIGVVNGVDAATYISTVPGDQIGRYEEGDIVFLKTDQIWRFRYSTRTNSISALPGYPRPISDEYKGLPNGVDAAFVWGNNGKLYFTKDGFFYGFAANEKGAKAEDPLPISMWEGVPNKLTAAFAYNPRRTNAKNYFFDKDQVYKFDDVALKVEAGYPIRTSWFLGCANTRIPGRLYSSSFILSSNSLIQCTVTALVFLFLKLTY